MLSVCSAVVILFASCQIDEGNSSAHPFSSGAVVEQRPPQARPCATATVAPPATTTRASSLSPPAIEFCIETLSSLPGKFSLPKIQQICAEVRHMPECNSALGKNIYHYQKDGKLGGLRILVLGVMHGDEPMSGSLSRAWMERLVDLLPRNSWRIIPVSNPDGLKLSTRTNANGVDLNRNFPSKNWNGEALAFWKRKEKRNPRRFPGKLPAGEKETVCIMKQILEFMPNLIVAIHTPLGVLDFDGPKVQYPAYKHLPWIRLGNFPGSLGRYMWHDRKVPVLTIELKGGDPLQKVVELDRLQDISGVLATMASRRGGPSVTDD
ncbi:MAG: DUF2817 domain-containing protein [Oligoflexia bacterium]|nr:DUF2817 domain-containing protein [Oligoflexia bacterium]